MKKIIVGIVIIFAIIGIGYLLPQFTIQQEKYEGLENSNEVACSINVIKKHLTFFEKLITTKIIIDLGGFMNNANIYTLFSIRYADADVTCDEDPFQLVRYWW